jgi:hypothetical protein
MKGLPERVRWRKMPVSTCEDICFMMAECQPANWYGLKSRLFRGGVALSAPGCLILLVHPLVNL